MAETKGLKQWVWEQRNVTRLAYLLQLCTRVGASFMGLIWTRLMLGAMGKELYGVLMAFQNVTTLGGLGDLGMGGAVGIRAGQYLGQGKQKELQDFLASARTVFLILALGAGAAMLALCPWLPKWLEFAEVPESGSITALFAVAAVSVAGLIVSSYLNNLNYACGNVTWPIIPSFLLIQLGWLGQWLLARQHQPLWIQWLPSLATMVAGLWLIRIYIRASNPALAGLRWLRFDRRTLSALLESSFWVYLCSLGNAIYRSTDALVINAGSTLGSFQPGELVGYQCNYKFCEMVVFLVLTASFVSLPKITQWMASDDPGDQERVRTEMRRLNQFQTLLGGGAALAYLAGNNLFMKIWWLHHQDPVLPAPLILQTAFALNLAVTASGDAGLQLALRAGSRGLRTIGIVVGITGLLNVLLSLMAMEMGSLWCIAMATVLAQSLLSLVASGYVCRHLRVAWVPWVVRGWLVPLVVISFAAWLRWKLPYDSAAHVVAVVGIYAGMFLAAAWAMGINAEFVKLELGILRKFLGR